MLFSSIAPVILLTAATAFAAPSASLVERASSAAPFGLEYAFSVNLTVGSASSSIPIYGGTSVTETIAQGTVTGPYVNATITGGQAFASVYKNGTVQVPSIELYGNTTDGLPFQVVEAGIGSTTGQITRIIFNVGGDKYAKLADGFILATVNPSKDRKTVGVQGYLVTNTAA